MIICKKKNTNIKSSYFSDFLEDIRKYGNEKTKQFFILSKENTKG